MDLLQNPVFTLDVKCGPKTVTKIVFRTNIEIQKTKLPYTVKHTMVSTNHAFVTSGPRFNCCLVPQTVYIRICLI